MKLERQVDVMASPEEVWKFFWNIPELASCIPGCTSARAEGEPGHYAATVKVRVGQFRVEFQLEIDVVDVVDGQKITARVQGTDRHTGARMVSDLQLRVLAAETGGAVVWLENDFQVYGRLASMGHSIVMRRGEDIMDEFAQNVRTRLSHSAPKDDASQLA
jgi:carbon monoxide dehydrogenase subunit G